MICFIAWVYKGFHCHKCGSNITVSRSSQRLGREDKKFLCWFCHLYFETFRIFRTSGKIHRKLIPGIYKIKTECLFNGLCSSSAMRFWMGITGRGCESVSGDQGAFVAPVPQTCEPSLGFLRPGFRQPVRFRENRRKDNAFDTHTNSIVYLTVSITSLYSMGVRSLLQNSCATSVVWPKACSVKRFTAHLSLRLPVITISLT